MSNVKAISVGELHSLREKSDSKKSLCLIDVRTPAEFSEVHAVDAINIPLHQFDANQAASKLGLSKDDTIYLICKMGGRSQKACENMLSNGYKNATNVAGGTDDWVRSALPIVQGAKKAFAINRQVQILAGSLALIGALLSFYNPYFAILPIFIGGGLVFSGLTNTCGMGTMLAMMPWNQAPKPEPPLPVKAPIEPNAEC
ncbi:MAG: rhodanese-like domain-containing protein [Mariniblastus sp.]